MLESDTAVPGNDPSVVPATAAGATSGGSSRRRTLVAAIVAVLLAQMVAMLCLSVSEESPTSDEVTYAAAAAAYARYHALDVNIEHPPLAKLIAGLPLRVEPAAVPRPTATLVTQQRIYGWRVLYRSGNSANHLLWLLRLPEIVLTALFGLVVFLFARDLWGDAGGLLALGLYSVTPVVLAHGSLATNDMVVTGLVLTALWLAWRGLRRPTLYLPLTGIALGAAMAAKATALLFAPVLVLLVAGALWRDAPGSRRRRLGVAAAGAGGIACAALATVWAVYLAVDPRLRVRFPHPLAEHFHSTAASVIRLLPLPRTYRLGLLYQSALEQRDFPVTMFGHTYPHGTWLFWPATLLVKTPLPLLVLGAVGAVVAVRQRRADVAAYVLLPAAVWFVIIVAGTSRPFGSRYLLLVPVLLAICAGAVVGDRLPRGRPRLLLAAAAVTLTVVTAVGSFLTYPYYLTYSNVAFGGSARTYHSLPQDADWDQDLRRVASYLRRHGVTGPIWWREHGGQPSAYGVQAVRATSAATVQGWLVVFGVERQFVDDSPRLRHLRPVAVIGNDVFVYQVP